MGSSVSRDPDTVKDPVDLARYAHIWYEIARLPVLFQANNTYGRAIYVLDDSREFIHITNTSMDVATGKQLQRSVSGTARPTQYNGQLSVKFWSWFPAGKYHIYYLNKHYTMAAVGSPDRKTLWILVEDRAAFNRAEFADVLTQMAKIGFDTHKMVFSIR